MNLENFKREQATIDEHLKICIEKQAMTRQQEKIEDKEFQQYWAQKNKKIEEREELEKVDARKRCQDLSSYHKMQAVSPLKHSRLNYGSRQ